MLEANLHPDKLHTVGRPGDGVELKFLDEAGRGAAAGEVGEIAGRAPMMMKGYYKQVEKTRELFWYDRDGRLFFKSGDMGKLDEDGFVVLLDRKKDMIISGGFNVYAADIEVLLLKHPDIVDVAVIGVPSDQWGESPWALAVPRPGAKISPDAVREWTTPTEQDAASGWCRISRLAAAQHDRQDHETRIARALLGGARRQNLRKR